MISFDFWDEVHFEYLPLGQPINKEYYLSVLKLLREAVSHKQPKQTQQFMDFAWQCAIPWILDNAGLFDYTVRKYHQTVTAIARFDPPVMFSYS